jgi:hypothetical protein
MMQPMLAWAAKGGDMANQIDLANTQSKNNPPPLDEAEGEGWTVADGRVSQQGQAAAQFNTDGVEPLTYNNPLSQQIERVWYDGKIVYALDAGDLDIPDAGNIKVAKEYQPVYSVDLDENGKMKNSEPVPGQYNIYDSIPGQDIYSPIWQFYYVVVPGDYQANTLRSAQDCQQSGYPIHQSNRFEN